MDPFTFTRNILAEIKAIFLHSEVPVTTTEAQVQAVWSKYRTSNYKINIMELFGLTSIKATSNSKQHQTSWLMEYSTVHYVQQAQFVGTSAV